MVGHRNHPRDSAFTPALVPRKDGKSSALVGHAIQIAPGAFDAGNTGRKQGLMHAAPIEETSRPVTPPDRSGDLCLNRGNGALMDERQLLAIRNTGR